MPSATSVAASWTTNCQCGSNQPGKLVTFSPGDNADNGFSCYMKCSACSKHTATYDADQAQSAADDWTSWTGIST